MRQYSEKNLKVVVCFIIIFLLVGCTGTEVKDYYGLKDNYVSKATFIVVDNELINVDKEVISLSKNLSKLSELK